MSVQFTVSLTDKVSGPAASIAQGFARAASQANALKKQMAAVEAQAVKAAALGDVGKMQALGKQYSSLGHAVGQLGTEFPGAINAIEQHNAAARAAAEQQKAYKNAIVQHKAALQQARTEEKGFTEDLSALAGPAMMAAGAILALTTAVVGLVYEGAKLALTASEMKEKTLAAFSALGGSKAAGEATLNMIRQLEKELPTSEAQLVSWSKTLMGAGLSGQRLAEALKAVAGSEALGGEAEKTMNLLAKLNEQGMKGTKLKFTPSMLVGTGLSEQDLMKALGMTPKQLELAKKQGTITGQQLSEAIVKALKTKGMGPMAEAMLEFSTQVTKLKDEVMKLFEDVNAKPFLAELAKLVKMFDTSTASGAAMKLLVTSTFNAIFQAAAHALPYIKVFLEGMIIAALRFYIALKPLGKALAETFKGPPNKEALAFFERLGELAIMTGPALTMVVSSLVKILQVVGFLQGASKAGGNAIGGGLVDGIIAGITRRAGAAIAAAKQLGLSLLAGTRAATATHSPSQKMMEIGQFMAQGLTLGVRAGNDNARAAGAELGTATMGGAAAAPSPPGGGGVAGAPVVIQIGAGAIVIQGGGNAQETKAMLLEALSTVMEQAALAAGIGSSAPSTSAAAA